MTWDLGKRSIPAFILGLLVGCSPTAKSTPATAPKIEASAPTTEAEHSIPEGLVKLNDADRASALAQKDCPVSGEPLGSMGTPLKLQVNDQSIWICCDGCEGKLKKDPDKYLAKIKP